jgi:hypothetical protein
MSQLRETIAALFYSGQLVELRVLGHKATYNLWFNEPDQLAEAAEEFSNDPSIKGTYVTLHTLDKQKICTKQRGVILNSLANMAKPAEQATTNDDVKSLNWFLIDCDPERTNGQSKSNSTRAEKKAAAERANVVHEYLSSQGWPEPILADSGNGWHMLYRVDIPLWKEHDGKLVGTGDALILRSCLMALSSMFSTPDAKIDISVWKPAQVTKLYGSMTRKGANEEDRPWRRSKLVDVPRPIETVPLEKLKELAALAPPEARKRQGEMPTLEEDFDIEDFCTFYGLEVIGEPYEKGDGRTYHILAECPLAGHKHSGDGNKTALIIGDTLGFHCWSDDCDGKTIGDLLRKLNETHNRYDGPLFVEQEIDWSKWAVEEAPMPEDEPVIPEDVDDDDNPFLPVPKILTKIAVDEKPFTIADPLVINETVIKPAEPEQPVVAPVAEEPARPRRLSEMPEDCMYGWLGEKTQELDVHIGFGYPAMLAMAATRVQAYPQHVRPSIYVCLIGPVHSGKSEAMRRAKAAFKWTNDEQIIEESPYSDRGLAKQLAGTSSYQALGPQSWKTPEVRLFLWDEMNVTMKKMCVQGSTLSSMLCTLWSSDKAGGADKKTSDKVHSRLNILGGIPVSSEQEFTEIFGNATSAGLYDRFVYGLMPSWKYTIPTVLPETRIPTVVTVPGYAYEMAHAWRDMGEGRERLCEIALRVMVITAGINEEQTVTHECAQAALNFMTWQEAIRDKFKPSLSEPDKESRCTEAIKNAIMNWCLEHPSDDGYAQWRKQRTYYQKGHWDRYGSGTALRCIKGLIDAQMIEQEMKIDDSEDKPKPQPTGRIRWAGRIK